MKPEQFALLIVTNDTPTAAIRAALSSALPQGRIIIASNASCDEADAAIKSALPGASLIPVLPERGLTYCWNIGLRLPFEAKWEPLPEWLVIANDDVVFDSDWLCEFESGFIACPNALHIGMAYPSNRYSCFAVHRDLVRKIGWFDERFVGIFYEDEDWHLRLSEYAKCAPGTRVHEDDEDGIFAIIDCALHDHGFTIADRKRFGKTGTLSRAANENFFLDKWRRAATGGWASKGKVCGEHGNFERVLPEIEWYPRELLGGTME